MSLSGDMGVGNENAIFLVQLSPHWPSCAAARYPPALRHRPWRTWSARLAEEEGRCRLISFGVLGCTSVRAFGKFPLKSLWRTHQHLDLLSHRLRSERHSRGLDKFPRKNLWRIHQDQHLDLSSQWFRSRLGYLVFFVFR